MQHMLFVLGCCFLGGERVSVWWKGNLSSSSAITGGAGQHEWRHFFAVFSLQQKTLIFHESLEGKMPKNNNQCKIVSVKFGKEVYFSQQIRFLLVSHHFNNRHVFFFFLKYVLLLVTSLCIMRFVGYYPQTIFFLDMSIKIFSWMAIQLPTGCGGVDLLAPPEQVVARLFISLQKILN